MVQGTGICCIALLPAIVATVAIGSSVLSTVWCEAIKFPPDLSGTLDIPNLSTQAKDVLSNEDGFATLNFGLYYYGQIEQIIIDSAGDTIVKVTDSCVEYPPGTNFDAAWKTARAFAAIAPIAGAVLALGLYMAPCCIFYNRATWNSMAFLFLIVVPALQSLTLLFLTSNACKDNPVIQSRLDQVISLQTPWPTTSGPMAGGNATAGNMTDAPADIINGGILSDSEKALRSIYAADCVWDWGTWANLLSMILFFVTGILMLIMGPPTRPPAKEPEIQTITYEQKADDNGGNKVAEVDVATDIYKPDAPYWANTAPNTPTYSGHESAKPY